MIEVVGRTSRIWKKCSSVRGVTSQAEAKNLWRCENRSVPKSKEGAITSATPTYILTARRPQTMGSAQIHTTQAQLIDVSNAAKTEQSTTRTYRLTPPSRKLGSINATTMATRERRHEQQDWQEAHRNSRTHQRASKSSHSDKRYCKKHLYKMIMT